MFTRYSLRFGVLAVALALAAPARAQGQFVLDSLYGTDGFHSVDFGTEDYARRIVDAGNGQLLFGGYAIVPTGSSSERVALSKADQCGAPVAGFGTNGQASYNFPSRNGYYFGAAAYDFAFLPNGKIIAVGQRGGFGASSVTPGVFRFNANGTPDLAFADSGAVSERYDPISSGFHRRVFVLPNGRILAAGSSNNNINGGQSGLGAMRYLSDGTLDPSYGGGTGKVRYAAPAFMSASAERQSTGRLVVIGNEETSAGHPLALVRFDSTGVLDPTFGNPATPGFVEYTSFQPDFSFRTALQPDDKILIAYSQTGNPNAYVARLTANGALDATFGTGGIKTIVPPAGIDFLFVTNIERLANGKLTLCGTANSNFAQRNQGFIAQLTATGALDATFGTNGVYLAPTTVFGGNSSSFRVVRPLANTQWLAFGEDRQNWYAARLTPISNVPHVRYTFPRLTTTGTGTLQWLFNGQPIAGASTNPYTPQQVGTYAVTLTDATGCSYTSAPVTVTQVAMGVADAAAGRAPLTVWPNPATGRTRVAWPADAPGPRPTAVVLLDGLGRVVRRQPWTGEGIAELDLRGLPAGLYSVRAGTRTRRLVVE